jgi:hypothetical protein
MHSVPCVNVWEVIGQSNSFGETYVNDCCVHVDSLRVIKNYKFLFHIKIVLNRCLT